MQPETRIDFTEASQAFLCDEYSMKNFIAFLEANSILIHSPERIESETAKKPFLLKLTKRIAALKPGTRERADSEIPRSGRGNQGAQVTALSEISFRPRARFPQSQRGS